MSLESIRTFLVRRDVADATNQALQEAGADGYELFVLWTGTIRGSDLELEHTYLPEQESFRGEEGLCVRVAGEALHELNRWLFEHNQTLAVQVHSHPTEAYHSDTDDMYPIVTQLGGLSIVVPDFGARGIRGAGVAAYRLTRRSWVRIAPSTFRTLVRFSD